MRCTEVLPITFDFFSVMRAILSPANLSNLISTLNKFCGWVFAGAMLLCSIKMDAVSYKRSQAPDIGSEGRLADFHGLASALLLTVKAINVSCNHRLDWPQSINGMIALTRFM